MPIYTFACSACGTTKEIVCKHGERDVIKETCAQCGDALSYVGVDGGQAVRANGRYEFKAILGSGQKVKTAKHKAKRSDY